MIKFEIVKDVVTELKKAHIISEEEEQRILKEYGDYLMYRESVLSVG